MRQAPLRGAPALGAVLGAVVLGIGALAGCTTATAGPGPTTTSTATRTVVRTQVSSPGADYHPPPAETVAPLPPGHPDPAGATDRRCPYIRTGLDEDGERGYHLKQPNVADLEGDRIYRTTVLTRGHPVGCRFYFYAAPYEAVADIVARRFPSATIAHNALVRTAEAGSEPLSAPAFARDAAGDRVDGISYRTRFFGPDHARDWAFAFAAGRTLVVVRTQRSDTSRPALYLARAIVHRF